MSLKFYDRGHQYELDGHIIPSVSEILRFLSREVYGDINRYILDRAAERGTEVHTATQQIDDTGECEIVPHMAGYVEAYAKFLREHDVEWIMSETPLAEKEMLFAGKIDRYGVLDGWHCILDLKTNAAITKPLVKAQLNGYKLLADYNNMPVGVLYCLQLLPTGRYRLYPTEIDDTEFMACYRMHYALKQKHPRGRII